jgi:hypothetical protein
MTSEEVPPELSAEDRLLGSAPPMKMPRSSKATPAGSVAAEWTKQWRVRELETPPVEAAGLRLVAVCHQHLLEARTGAAVTWSFIADGRISSPPVVVGDAAVFGDHAGWVYSVALKDGAMRWKHLVAPFHRGITSNGQLESAWPVYGVAVMDDLIIASAGTHVGIGGGVWVTGLRPGTGESVWRKRIFLSPNLVPPAGKGARIVDHTFLNSAPRIEGDEVILGDGGRKGGLFRFRPTASDEEVTEQLLKMKAR